MPATTATRILRSTVLVIAAGAVIAGALGLGAWYLLPHVRLEVDTAAARFAVWEGVMWALGLAGTLFGAAALLNATDLYSSRPLEQVFQQASDARRGRTLYSGLPLVPWIVLSAGVALLVIAMAARSVAPG